jgi:N utilization substance protein A
MSNEMALAIKMLVQERGVSEDLIRKTIEESLLAAYKKKYGIDENAVVRFNEEGTEVTIFAQKRIVDEIADPVTEISLEQALEYNEESEIGDELLIEINPREFDRVSIQSAKQKTKQTLREIQKDTLYSEFKGKIGEMVIGYYQRERNGTIYVDLGKTEGIFPRRFQSPRETYHTNDRIKALIYEVNKSPSGLQIVLSRTHTDFVKRVFELEVPEIYDGTVEIFKIVREPGYRTKIAVYSNRDDVDPVGACVGLKGVRIQAIVRELEGERIDILKYDPDSQAFIKNALSPAEILHVVLIDEAKKQALAVVGENQLSLTIGKQGLNVRLANRMVDWNIDVRTEEQFAEMDITMNTRRAVSALFGEVEEEEITKISELPGVPEEVVKILNKNNLELLEDLVSMDLDSLKALDGMSEDNARVILKVIKENVQIVEEEEEKEEEEAEKEEREEIVLADEAEENQEEEEEEEVYECPECGATITLDMAVCSNCGVGLSFEEEEDAGEKSDES